MTTDASACQLGVFDMFTLGIGPSSSHTVGPMRAGRHFGDLLLSAGMEPSRVRVTLFGSLAATGIGHGTNRAVLLGLAGARPETVETDLVDQIIPRAFCQVDWECRGGQLLCELSCRGARTVCWRRLTG